jgi:hypothetical protein
MIIGRAQLNLHAGLLEHGCRYLLRPLYISRKVNDKIIRERILSQNDVPGRTSRPSLLSEQAQAPQAADSQSILSKLDGRASPSGLSPVPRKPGRMSGMAAAIVAAVVLGGGVLAWALQDGSEQAGTSLAAAATPVPAPVPMPAVSTGDAASTAAGAPVGEQAALPESEVSAATILDEAPGGAVAATAAALTLGAAAAVHTPDDGKSALAEVSDKPAAPAVQAGKPGADGGNVRSKPPARKKSEPARVARKDKAHASDRKTTLAATHRKKPAARAPAQVDTDVALLAALLAHSKASGAPNAGKTAAEYRRCSTLDSAGANKCRERLCEGSARARAECKALRADKASG